MIQMVCLILCLATLLIQVCFSVDIVVDLFKCGLYFMAVCFSVALLSCSSQLSGLWAHGYRG